MIYAGIGSRKTPGDIMDLMSRIAEVMAKKGHILRSGGADGADNAFEKGHLMVTEENMEIWLPWTGFNGRNYDTVLNRDKHKWAFDLALRNFPWVERKPVVWKFAARNMLQVFGADGKVPVDAVICWTKDAKVIGGTAYALKIVMKYPDIKIYNLANANACAKWEEWLRKSVA